MADQKISALTSYTPAISTDVFPVVDVTTGTTKKITLSNLITSMGLSSVYQPLDSDLTAIAALSSADSNFIVGSAGGWVAESGATARTSLGLGTGDSPIFANMIISDATGGQGIQFGMDIARYANIWTTYGAGDIVLATGMKGGTGAGTYLSSYGSSIGRAAIRINAFTGTGGSLHFFTDADATVAIDGEVTPTERMTIDSAGNISIAGTAQRASTVGTNALHIFNGTAPAGTLTNGCSIYSTSGELYTMDAAGNATLQTPHDDENYWVFDSVNTVTGKRLVIDMEKMMRKLNEKFGWDFVHELIS